MSIDVSETQIGFDVGGSRVSTGGTGGETVETGIDNDTDSEEGTVSDILTRTCREKYRIYSKNITSADTKYFMVEGL